MSQDQIETAFSKTIQTILELAGNATADFVSVLHGKAIEITVSHMEEYLKMLKELQSDYEKETTLMSPRLNDSMLVHRNRLSRTSKSRLTFYRNSPEVLRFTGSPMDIDMENVSASKIETILEESSFIDPTIAMDETTHQRGFLADVSDMNGTVRSRNPSSHFNYISPVSSERTRRSSGLKSFNTTIDFDADVSSLIEAVRVSRRLHAGNEEADGLRTPPAHQNITINLTDDDMTPVNLWNVKLRPGSNRKIDNEIRKEIQRQLARDARAH